MRKLYRSQFPNVPREIQALFNQIIEASQTGDITDIAAPYQITGTFTPTRTLNVSAPTLANVAAVVATLISDLKAGGANRTT